MSIIRLTAFLLALFPLVSCQAAQSEQQRGVTLEDTPLEMGDFGVYRALIVGINSYEHWPVLQFAEQDARDLSEILVSEYGFQPEHVVSLIGADATESHIRNALKDLLNESSEKDNILIYYAGHGQLDPLTDSGNWIPVDGDLYDESSWIPFSVVRTLLTAEKVKAERILVITDSCYGGALARSGPTPGKLNPDDSGYLKSLQSLLHEKSRQVMASGGFEEVPDRSHFAELLKSALRMNPYPVVDMEFIFYTEVFPNLRLIGTQYPTMVRMVSGPKENGQFILVKEGVSMDALNSEVEEEPPVSEESRGNSDVKMQADVEFWNTIKESSDPDLFQEYLRQFPDGVFAVIAQKRLDDLVSAEQTSHKVPKLVGMNVKSALGILEDLGFKQGRITQEESGADEGTVLSQSPEPDSPAEEGSPIDLVIAEVASRLKMPKLIGLSRAALAEAVAKYGLTIGKVEYVSMERAGVKEAGIVVAQSPEAGTAVEPKSSVNLIFSRGEQLVPNLIGQSEDRAKAIIERVGLRVGEIKRVAKGKAGTVIGQSPKAGDRVERGSEVLLYIASPISSALSLQAIKNSVATVARPLNAALAAPVPSAPADGSVFNQYPRKTELSWNPVQGAVSYAVEVEFQSGSSWHSLFTRDDIRSVRYTFNFVGAQPGRWRVWAVDSKGNAGVKSDWRTFVYKR